MLGVVEVLMVIVVDFWFVDVYMFCVNIVVVVIDGMVVLGFGNIGLVVVFLVMEGKVVLFKYFVGVDVVLVCFDIMDVDELVDMVVWFVLMFGGINFEDILVLCCFEVEWWL